ncbi:ABC transporter ATP-binding protein [Rhizobium changzhiense]|uniref:ABC transporter ATP-binding protein n=1 Tax=Rhizobium changzhiense TaxID=2692317 RepID=A0A7Z0RPG9_9HYPH|nr:ABC transporter ATP-binding protein [Rhizobium changzhiense]MBA5804913.1 ABC transporter ATP-binding protein [Rhizobium changzhiense]NZD63356.1 ABC transporter ATP-binding protein [Rhizobium changzhiense]
MPEAAAIETKDLAIGYAGAVETTRILSGVDLSVGRGEFLTILGPSGCGKSTLLRAVADLLPPLDGRLSVLGKTASEARRRREVAFVFQDATLLPWRTVRENVALPLQVGKNSVSRSVDPRPDHWIELVGLSHLADRYPHQLSGGQRQRVAIARALQCEPDILLMDEPFGALDEITRERLNDELLDVWRRTGTTILFVTHSVVEAIYLGGRVLVLAANPGRVQALIDLAPLKDERGLCRRESLDVQETAAHLRQLLQQGSSAA